MKITTCVILILTATNVHSQTSRPYTKSAYSNSRPTRFRNILSDANGERPGTSDGLPDHNFQRIRSRFGDDATDGSGTPQPQPGSVPSQGSGPVPTNIRFPNGGQNVGGVKTTSGTLQLTHSQNGQNIKIAFDSGYKRKIDSVHKQDGVLSIIASLFGNQLGSLVNSFELRRILYSLKPGTTSINIQCKFGQRGGSGLNINNQHAGNNNAVLLDNIENILLQNLRRRLQQHSRSSVVTGMQFQCAYVQVDAIEDIETINLQQARYLGILTVTITADGPGNAHISSSFGGQSQAELDKKSTLSQGSDDDQLTTGFQSGNKQGGVTLQFGQKRVGQGSGSGIIGNKFQSQFTKDTSAGATDEDDGITTGVRTGHFQGGVKTNAGTLQLTNSHNGQIIKITFNSKYLQKVDGVHRQDGIFSIIAPLFGNQLGSLVNSFELRRILYTLRPGTTSINIQCKFGKRGSGLNIFNQHTGINNAIVLDNIENILLQNVRRRLQQHSGSSVVTGMQFQCAYVQVGATDDIKTTDLKQTSYLGILTVTIRAEGPGNTKLSSSFGEQSQAELDVKSTLFQGSDDDQLTTGFHSGNKQGGVTLQFSKKRGGQGSGSGTIRNKFQSQFTKDTSAGATDEDDGITTGVRTGHFQGGVKTNAGTLQLTNSHNGQIIKITFNSKYLQKVDGVHRQDGILSTIAPLFGNQLGSLVNSFALRRILYTLRPGTTSINIQCKFGKRGSGLNINNQHAGINNAILLDNIENILLQNVKGRLHQHSGSSVVTSMQFQCAFVQVGATDDIKTTDLKQTSYLGILTVTIRAEGPGNAQISSSFGEQSQAELDVKSTLSQGSDDDQLTTGFQSGNKQGGVTLQFGKKRVGQGSGSGTIRNKFQSQFTKDTSAGATDEDDGITTGVRTGHFQGGVKSNAGTLQLTHSQSGQIIKITFHSKYLQKVGSVHRQDGILSTIAPLFGNQLGSLVNSFALRRILYTLRPGTTSINIQCKFGKRGSGLNINNQHAGINNAILLDNIENILLQNVKGRLQQHSGSSVVTSMQFQCAYVQEGTTDDIKTTDLKQTSYLGILTVTIKAEGPGNAQISSSFGEQSQAELDKKSTLSQGSDDDQLSTGFQSGNKLGGVTLQFGKKRVDQGTGSGSGTIRNKFQSQFGKPTSSTGTEEDDRITADVHSGKVQDGVTTNFGTRQVGQGIQTGTIRNSFQSGISQQTTGDDSTDDQTNTGVPSGNQPGRVNIHFGKKPVGQGSGSGTITNKFRSQFVKDTGITVGDEGITTGVRTGHFQGGVKTNSGTLQLTHSLGGQIIKITFHSKYLRKVDSVHRQDGILSIITPLFGNQLGSLVNSFELRRILYTLRPGTTSINIQCKFGKRGSGLNINNQHRGINNAILLDNIENILLQNVKGRLQQHSGSSVVTSMQFQCAYVQEGTTDDIKTTDLKQTSYLGILTVNIKAEGNAHISSSFGGQSQAELGKKSTLSQGSDDDQLTTGFQSGNKQGGVTLQFGKKRVDQGTGSGSGTIRNKFQSQFVKPSSSVGTEEDDRITADVHSGKVQGGVTTNFGTRQVGQGIQTGTIRNTFQSGISQQTTGDDSTDDQTTTGVQSGNQPGRVNIHFGKKPVGQGSGSGTITNKFRSQFVKDTGITVGDEGITTGVRTGHFQGGVKTNSGTLQLTHSLGGQIIKITFHSKYLRKVDSVHRQDGILSIITPLFGNQLGSLVNSFELRRILYTLRPGTTSINIQCKFGKRGSGLNINNQHRGINNAILLDNIENILLQNVKGRLQQHSGSSVVTSMQFQCAYVQEGTTDDIKTTDLKQTSYLGILTVNIKAEGNAHISSSFGGQSQAELGKKSTLSQGSDDDQLTTGFQSGNKQGGVTLQFGKKRVDQGTGSGSGTIRNKFQSQFVKPSSSVGTEEDDGITADVHSGKVQGGVTTNFGTRQVGQGIQTGTIRNTFQSGISQQTTGDDSTDDQTTTGVQSGNQPGRVNIHFGKKPVGQGSGSGTITNKFQSQIVKDAGITFEDERITTGVRTGHFQGGVKTNAGTLQLTHSLGGQIIKITFHSKYLRKVDGVHRQDGILSIITPLFGNQLGSLVNSFELRRILYTLRPGTTSINIQCKFGKRGSGLNINNQHRGINNAILLDNIENILLQNVKGRLQQHSGSSVVTSMQFQCAYVQEGTTDDIKTTDLKQTSYLGILTVNIKAEGNAHISSSFGGQSQTELGKKSTLSQGSDDDQLTTGFQSGNKQGGVTLQFGQKRGDQGSGSVSGTIRNKFQSQFVKHTSSVGTEEDDGITADVHSGKVQGGVTTNFGTRQVGQGIQTGTIRNTFQSGISQQTTGDDSTDDQTTTGVQSGNQPGRVNTHFGKKPVGQGSGSGTITNKFQSQFVKDAGITVGDEGITTGVRTGHFEGGVKTNAGTLQLTNSHNGQIIKITFNSKYLQKVDGVHRQDGILSIIAPLFGNQLGSLVNSFALRRILYTLRPGTTSINIQCKFGKRGSGLNINNQHAGINNAILLDNIENILLQNVKGRLQQHSGSSVVIGMQFQCAYVQGGTTDDIKTTDLKQTSYLGILTVNIKAEGNAHISSSFGEQSQAELDKKSTLSQGSDDDQLTTGFQSGNKQGGVTLQFGQKRVGQGSGSGTIRNKFQSQFVKPTSSIGTEEDDEITANVHSGKVQGGVRTNFGTRQVGQVTQTGAIRNTFQSGISQQTTADDSTDDQLITGVQSGKQPGGRGESIDFGKKPVGQGIGGGIIRNRFQSQFVKDAGITSEDEGITTGVRSGHFQGGVKTNAGTLQQTHSQSGQIIKITFNSKYLQKVGSVHSKDGILSIIAPLFGNQLGSLVNSFELRRILYSLRPGTTSINIQCKFGKRGSGLNINNQHAGNNNAILLDNIENILLQNVRRRLQQHSGSSIVTGMQFQCAYVEVGATDDIKTSDLKQASYLGILTVTIRAEGPGNAHISSSFGEQSQAELDKKSTLSQGSDDDQLTTGFQSGNKQGGVTLQFGQKRVGQGSGSGTIKSKFQSQFEQHTSSVGTEEDDGIAVGVNSGILQDGLSANVGFREQMHLHHGHVIKTTFRSRYVQRSGHSQTQGDALRVIAPLFGKELGSLVNSVQLQNILYNLKPEKADINIQCKLGKPENDDSINKQNIGSNDERILENIESILLQKIKNRLQQHGRYTAVTVMQVQCIFVQVSDSNIKTLHLKPGNYVAILTVNIKSEASGTGVHSGNVQGGVTTNFGTRQVGQGVQTGTIRNNFQSGFVKQTSGDDSVGDQINTDFQSEDQPGRLIIQFGKKPVGQGSGSGTIKNKFESQFVQHSSGGSTEEDDGISTGVRTAHLQDGVSTKVGIRELTHTQNGLIRRITFKSKYVQRIEHGDTKVNGLSIIASLFGNELGSLTNSVQLRTILYSLKPAKTDINIQCKFGNLGNDDRINKQSDGAILENIENIFLQKIKGRLQQHSRFTVIKDMQVECKYVPTSDTDDITSFDPNQASFLGILTVNIKTEGSVIKHSGSIFGENSQAQLGQTLSQGNQEHQTSVFRSGNQQGLSTLHFGNKRIGQGSSSGSAVLGNIAFLFGKQFGSLISNTELQQVLYGLQLSAKDVNIHCKFGNTLNQESVNSQNADVLLKKIENLLLQKIRSRLQQHSKHTYAKNLKVECLYVEEGASENAQTGSQFQGGYIGSVKLHIKTEGHEFTRASTFFGGQRQAQLGKKGILLKQVGVRDGLHTGEDSRSTIVLEQDDGSQHKVYHFLIEAEAFGNPGKDINGKTTIDQSEKRVKYKLLQVHPLGARSNVNVKQDMGHQ